MKNISELIRSINRRPKMFIPDLKIDQLYFYISGFLLAKKTNELLENIDISFCEEFNSWLAHKINYKNKFSTIMGFFIEWILEKENLTDIGQ